jgi:hypothetical protein
VDPDFVGSSFEILQIRQGEDYSSNENDFRLYRMQFEENEKRCIETASILFFHTEHVHKFFHPSALAEAQWVDPLAYPPWMPSELRLEFGLAPSSEPAHYYLIYAAL